MKKILIPAICVSLAMVSCKKETKVEEAAVDNTKEVENVAKNATVDSSQVAEYNKDEAEMIDNNPGVTLKNAAGEELKLQFEEKNDGSKYLTYTKGKDAPVKVGLITGHEGKDVYGDDKITIEISESGGKAVFMGADKKKVEYK